MFWRAVVKMDLTSRAADLTLQAYCSVSSHGNQKAFQIILSEKRCRSSSSLPSDGDGQRSIQVQLYYEMSDCTGVQATCALHVAHRSSVCRVNCTFRLTAYDFDQFYAQLRTSLLLRDLVS